MKKLLTALLALAMLLTASAMAEVTEITYESRGVQVPATLTTPDGDTAFGTAKDKMSPVLEAPFYAVQVNPISTSGIDIAVYTDENMNELLENGGAAVPNLYACGGAGSGSYFSLCNIGLGSHVVGCMTSGVVAGSCARDALTK